MSRFYKMDKAELAKIVKRQDAYRHFTYLALQNDRNKSLLDEVSEKNSSKESLCSSIRRDRGGQIQGRFMLQEPELYSKSNPVP